MPVHIDELSDAIMDLNREVRNAVSYMNPEDAKIEEKKAQSKFLEFAKKHNIDVTFE